MMGVDKKMDGNGSDDDMDFIKRPAILINHAESLSEDDSRPVTPPMDRSLKLNKSLGLMLSPQSPPYRKIRSMKIESPRPFLKSRLDHQALTSTPNMSPCAQNSFKRGTRTSSLRLQRSRLSHFNQTDLKDKQLSPAAFINPFSPNYNNVSRNGNDSKTKKPKRGIQKRFNFDSDDLNEEDVFDDQDSQIEIKKPRLSDFNIPRYQEEFIELEVIGVGEHGQVVKCLNRLNGIEYAVKRGLKPVNNERIAHNEIYAHGVLEHPNIVRNYSSWTENDHVYMQNEYCNGGSLEDTINHAPLDERQLRRVLEHISQGLRFIHSKNLAHMDIKPGNILISKGPKMFYRQMFLDADEFGDDDDSNEETIYKIADLGHVTKLDEVVDVEEGDCRYLPTELLNNFSDLSKVDIFALGLTLYEAAGGGPLPKNGEEWHSIREGKLKPLPHLSFEFYNLIKKMIHPNPECRPSASELLMETVSSPVYKTVKDKHELKAAKQKIQLLEQQLQDVYKCVKVIRSQSQDTKRPVTHNNNKGERLIGKKSKRSQSTTNF